MIVRYKIYAMALKAGPSIFNQLQQEQSSGPIPGARISGLFQEL